MSKNTSEQNQAVEEVYDPASKKHKEQQRDAEVESADEDNEEQTAESSKQQKQQSQEEDDVTEEEDNSEEDDSDDDDSEDDDDELYQRMIGKKVNKEGQVVDRKTGVVLGKVVDGKLKRLSGKKVGENGEIVNDKGKVIGRVEPVRDDDESEEESEEEKPDQEEPDQSAEKKQEPTAEATEENPSDVNEPAESEEKAPSADEKEDEQEEQQLSEEKASTEENKGRDIKDADPESTKAKDDGAKEDDEVEKRNVKEEGPEDDVTADTTADDANDDKEDKPEDIAETKAEELKEDVAKEGEKVEQSDVKENIPEEAVDETKANKPKDESAPEDSDNEDNTREVKKGDTKEQDKSDEGELEVASKDDTKEKAEEEVKDLNAGDEAEEKPFNPYELVDENSPEVRKSGKIVDMEDNVIGTIDKSIAPRLAGFKVDPEGNVVNDEGHIVGRAQLFEKETPAEDETDKPFNPNENVNEDSPEVRKSGKVVDMEDNIVGHVNKNLAPKFAGFKVDPEGNIIDHDGEIVGQADMIKEEPVEEEEEEKPFNPNPNVDENSPEVRKSGKIVDDEDNVIGTIDKEKAAQFVGLKVDKDGNVIDKDGRVVAQAELFPDEEENKPFNPNENVNEDSPEVRKSGKVVDMEDNIVGKVDKDKAPKLAGFKVDKDGNVINHEGHIVAKAEMFKEEEEDKPFNPYDMVDEDSPEVRKSGKIFDMDDNVVGYIDKRLAAKLAGFKVDPEGNVVNNDGHIVGKAEMIKQEEEKEEPKEEEKPKETTVDENSPEVRRSGKVLDMDDNVIGQVEKRLAAKFAGFKVDDDGNIVNHDGEIVGKAEIFPKEDKDKPFNPYAMIDENSPEVKKSGKVVDMDDNVVGYVDKRIASKLAGCKVDDEGNIINSEGHIAGKAEMFKEEEEEPKEEEKDKPFNPNTMVDEHSPTVRRSGKVVDEDDNVVGYVDKSAAHKLVGFPVDDDGNIINEEGQIVGKAKMVGQKSEEEIKKEQEEEEYRKIADQMSTSIQQSLDKIKPVLRQITDLIDEEEAKPEKERDEEKLVSNVKPLIEQGSSILEEANGAIRGLDPTGRIAKRAQAKTSERKASPEEYHLADLLAQLSGDVTTTIDKAKKKLRTMPHAKKQLSPLWNILQSPLLQILSAVGLLLSGVLGLVGNILNGLGLGSIINSLLGGIGLNKILEGFGLADALKLGSRKK